ncbi:unnamed protein product [Porites evermanni]|uniref:Tubulin--tyrosine ligase n=1 Tax=Porites evermanni TaxID=104178 RepID=A0ABN8Q3L6_9CNID|nr:unnamed protein product [Porites evermanni]
MYILVNRDEDSSVYNYIAQQLLNGSLGHEKWTLAPKNSERFNLLFGERKSTQLDYTRIGHTSGLCQAVNYYRGSERLLCKKVPLVKYVRSLAESEQLAYQWMPVSFIILPEHLKSKSEMRKKLHAKYTDERNNLMAFSSTLKEKIWIAKSSSGAKGKNIFISDNIEEILAFVDVQTQGYVVQKYIENPLLLDKNRKFDIRCWVLLDHKYNIYIFSEGVLRTSSEPYDPNNLKNITSHLTNHCIQEEYSTDFGHYEEGNEMFFNEFSRFLEEKHQVSLKEDILPQINTIVRKCLLGLKEELTTEGLGYHSFQLFGFDFMVDSQFHVWLLEVNGAPASAKSLLPDLAEELVKKAIDPLFPNHNNNEPGNNCHSDSKKCCSPSGGFFKKI